MRVVLFDPCRGRAGEREGDFGASRAGLSSEARIELRYRAGRAEGCFPGEVGITGLPNT
jgi:hypothetical protein